MARMWRGGTSQRTAGKPALSKAAQDRIGRELRAYYQELVDAPIPDKLQQLLTQLDNEEQESGESGSCAEGDGKKAEHDER